MRESVVMIGSVDMREFLIQELVNARVLKRVGDGLYSDGGNHLVHESYDLMTEYIWSFLLSLDDGELLDVFRRARVKSDG